MSAFGRNVPFVNADIEMGDRRGRLRRRKNECDGAQAEDQVGAPLARADLHRCLPAGGGHEDSVVPEVGEFNGRRYAPTFWVEQGLVKRQGGWWIEQRKKNEAAKKVASSSKSNRKI